MAGKYRKRSSRRHRKGGSGSPDPSTYSSATTYNMAVNGTGDSQYQRVFSQSSPDAAYSSNQSVGVQGQNLGYPQSATINNSLIQKAGAKSRRRKSGGFWGHIVNQALVPFSILGMQQSYRRKKNGGTKKRRN